MGLVGISDLVAKANEPVSSRWIDGLVSFALVVWTFGQVVFAYSFVAQIPSVAKLDIAQMHQAITAGCLVASLASRGFDLRPRGMALLFLALFATLTVWRIDGDARPIVILLFAVVTRGMNLSRLARRYVVGLLSGTTVVAVWALLSDTMTFALSSTDGAFVPTFGFIDAGVVAALVFSLPPAIALGSRDARAWIPLSAICVLAAVVEALVLRAAFLGVLLIGFAVVATLYGTRPRRVVPVIRLAWVRWGIALLPIVLFCLCNDGTKFFGFPPLQGGYASLTNTYGFGAYGCIALAYVYSVLLCGCTGRDFLALCACVMFAFGLMTTVLPLYLEFNCTLLLLSQGLAGLGVEVASEEEVAVDVREGA